MKRLAGLALICGLSAMVPAAFAQAEHTPEQAAGSAAEHAPESRSEPGGGQTEMWKWANFVLLAGALGYLIGKNAGPFFDSRSQQIQKDMIEAAAARKDAEARAAEVDRRLASLETDIAALRAESQQEAAAETERLAQQSMAEIAKIQAHAEQEIVSAGKAARMELKRYSAHLAVDLAEQKIRARMTPDSQDALVRSFVDNLK